MRKLSIRTPLLMLICVILTIPTLSFKLQKINASEAYAGLAVDDYSYNVTFRESYGLDSTAEAILNAVKSGTNDTFGAYLTEEENKDISERIARQDYIPEIEKNSVSLLEDNYLGLYMDQLQKGKIIIGVRDLSIIRENDLTSIKRIIPEPHMIDFVEKKYSRKELEEVTEKLSDESNNLAAKGVLLQSVTSQFSKQQITVELDTSMSSRTQKQIDANYSVLLDIVNDKELLNVVQGTTPIKSYNARYNNNYDPVPGGAGIEIMASATSASRCTLGFSVTESGGHEYPFLLTAGHCVENRLNKEVRSGGWPIGTAYIHSNYDGTTADAGLIMIDDVDITTSWVLDSASSYGNSLISTDWLSDVEGITVCSSLATSNANRCGLVDSTDYDVIVSGKGTIINPFNVNNQRKVLFNAQEGDSGAPAYVACSGCGIYKGAYGLVVAGNNVNHVAISYITNIKSELSIKFKKNDNDTITITN